MEHSKRLSNELFYCTPLTGSEKDARDIASFSVIRRGGKTIGPYLETMAWIDEYTHQMRTYMVRDNITDELVAYFSLKAGEVSWNETPNGAFDMYPGVEIANFAMNDNYIRKHKNTKGSGIIIFHEFIMKIIRDVAKLIGVKVVYIFALDEMNLIKLYESKYKFKRLSKMMENLIHNRMKPQYDRDCIFMYQLLK